MAYANKSTLAGNLRGTLGKELVFRDWNYTVTQPNPLTARSRIKAIARMFPAMKEYWRSLCNKFYCNVPLIDHLPIFNKIRKGIERDRGVIDLIYKLAAGSNNKFSRITAYV